MYKTSSHRLLSAYLNSTYITSTNSIGPCNNCNPNCFCLTNLKPLFYSTLTRKDGASTSYAVRSRASSATAKLTRVSRCPPVGRRLSALSRGRSLTPTSDGKSSEGFKGCLSLSGDISRRYLCDASESRYSPRSGMYNFEFDDDETEPLFGASKIVREKPSISREEIDKTLRKNEISSRFPDHEIIEGYDANQLSSNTPIEDHHAIGQCTTTGAWLFGVFDGHGGAECSRALASRLFNYCCMALLPPDRMAEMLKTFDREEFYSAFTTVKLDSDLLSSSAQKHWSNVETFFRSYATRQLDPSDTVNTVVIDALQAAFAAMDADITADAMPDVHGRVNKTNVMTAVCGSCATVAQIRGPNLHIANVGDSSAVLGVCTDAGSWTARPLVQEHCIDNPSEVKRIRGEHPLKEHDSILKGGRLLGELFPLRAFGDVRYKWSAELQQVVITPVVRADVTPKGLLTPPYLTSQPEVFYHRLTPNDKFLIIASDGLWDELSPERAVKLVADHLLGKETLSAYSPPHEILIAEVLADLRVRKAGGAKKPLDANAATHLIRTAIGGNNVNTQYDKLGASLSLPKNVVRAYRDDITVQIIYFNQVNLEDSSFTS